jgi:hypothetical protein
MSGGLPHYVSVVFRVLSEGSREETPECHGILLPPPRLRRDILSVLPPSDLRVSCRSTPVQVGSGSFDGEINLLAPRGMRC